MSLAHATLNLKDHFHVDKKLEKIWSEYFTEDQNPISALYQTEILKNSITFLSLNPSLNLKKLDEKDKGYYPRRPYPLIDWAALKPANPFYKKFYNLGDEIKPWTAIELLYIRETDQKKLVTKFDSEFTTEKDKAFVINQMKLTFDIINELNPKVVVVSNLFSVRLIHKFLHELKLKQVLPNEENGWIYRINGIPFITNESRFLGSRFHSSNVERHKKLVEEIMRVIATCKI